MAEIYVCGYTVSVCYKNLPGSQRRNYKYDALHAMCVSLSSQCVRLTEMTRKYNIMRSVHYAVRVRVDDVDLIFMKVNFVDVNCRRDRDKLLK